MSNPNPMADYWENRISTWEVSVYDQGPSVPLLDRIASPFRRILRERLERTIDLVSTRVAGRSVVDCGCGSGKLLFRLLAFKPSRLVGVDIAPSAIERANAILNAEETLHGIQLPISFQCVDLRQTVDVLDGADLVIGIGFLDYLSPEEFGFLASALRGKEFLFSFPERRVSARELVHRVYLLLAHCPGAHKYSRREASEILHNAGITDFWFDDRNNLRFVTNLPRSVIEAST